MAYNVNHLLRVGDAKTIHDNEQAQIDGINNAIKGVGTLPILINGNIANDKWSTYNITSPRSMVIPVSGGESLEIYFKTDAYGYYAGLTSFTNPPTHQASVQYSAAEGWTSNHYQSAGRIVKTTIPSDVRYLYIFTGANNANIPDIVSINGYNYGKSVVENIRDGAVVETISDAAPTITGVPNVRYVCGTVTSISITPAQTGITDVIFTSGSTPAVLTLPGTVLLPAWFDATALEANTTYEINIMDGTYGAVSVWAAS